MDYYNTKTKQYYYQGQQFTLDGIQYPSNWFSLATPDEITSLGFKKVIYCQTVDPMFYDIKEHRDAEYIRYTWSPKPLPPIKETLKHQVRGEAYRCLLPTDWYVVRKQETGEEIPSKVLADRQNIRNLTDTYCTQVDACTLTNQLENLPKPKLTPVEG